MTKAFCPIPPIDAWDGETEGGGGVERMALSLAKRVGIESPPSVELELRHFCNLIILEGTDSLVGNWLFFWRRRSEGIL